MYGSICPNGHAVDAGFSFCPSCGEPVGSALPAAPDSGEDSRCPRGHSFEVGDVFCPTCGCSLPPKSGEVGSRHGSPTAGVPVLGEMGWTDVIGVQEVLPPPVVPKGPEGTTGLDRPSPVALPIVRFGLPGPPLPPRKHTKRNWLIAVGVLVVMAGIVGVVAASGGQGNNGHSATTAPAATITPAATTVPSAALVAEVTLVRCESSLTSWSVWVGAGVSGANAQQQWDSFWPNNTYADQISSSTDEGLVQAEADFTYENIIQGSSYTWIASNIGPQLYNQCQTDIGNGTTSWPSNAMNYGMQKPAVINNGQLEESPDARGYDLLYLDILNDESSTTTPVAASTLPAASTVPAATTVTAAGTVPAATTTTMPPGFTMTAGNSSLVRNIQTKAEQGTLADSGGSTLPGAVVACTSSPLNVGDALACILSWNGYQAFIVTITGPGLSGRQLLFGPEFPPMPQGGIQFDCGDLTHAQISVMHQVGWSCRPVSASPF